MSGKRLVPKYIKIPTLRSLPSAIREMLTDHGRGDTTQPLEWPRSRRALAQGTGPLPPAGGGVRRATTSEGWQVL